MEVPSRDSRVQATSAHSRDFPLPGPLPVAVARFPVAEVRAHRSHLADWRRASPGAVTPRWLRAPQGGSSEEACPRTRSRFGSHGIFSHPGCGRVRGCATDRGSRGSPRRRAIEARAPCPATGSSRPRQVGPSGRCRGAARHQADRGYHAAGRPRRLDEGHYGSWHRHDDRSDHRGRQRG